METEITQGVTEAVEATGGIAALGINAKLLLAQLIHFGIVLLIFWKWIYGPVKAMLQKRQETIEKSLEDAKLFEERLTKIEKTTMLHETKNAIAELAVEIARKVLTETIDQDVAQKKAQQAIKDVFGS